MPHAEPESDLPPRTPDQDPLLALLRARHGTSPLVRKTGEAMLARIAALHVRTQTLAHMVLHAKSALRVTADTTPRLIPAEVLRPQDIQWHPLSGLPAPEHIPEFWDGPHVGKRLIEAFQTLRLLPLNLYPRDPSVVRQHLTVGL